MQMQMKTVSSLFGAGLQLAVIACGLLPGQPLPAAVTLTVTPAAITNDLSGKISLHVTGLTTGQTVRIEKYVDLNGNGVIDPLEFPVESFLVTDGQLPLIGGVRNANVPGDEDGATDGNIHVKLYYPWVDNVVDTAPGNFIYRLSDPSNGFSPVTQTFSVAQKVLPQGVTGTVSLGGVPAPYASVGLFPQNAPGGRLVFADSGGHYVIYAPPGNYGLGAFGYGVFANPSSVTVNANQFLTNNVGLIAGTITVSGAVTDSASGTGIPSVFLVAQSTNKALAIGWTDASGNYSLQVTPGLWTLQPSQKSLAQVGYVGPDRRQTNLTSATMINFAVPLATALIYGTLQAAPSTPLPGIEVDAEQQAGKLGLQGRSFPPDGAYALGVVAGTWDVGPSSDDPGLAGFAGVQSSTVTLTNGQAQRLDFTVQSFTTHLRGRAVDNTGAAVANLSLGVSPPNGGPWRSSTQTGPDGSFDLGMFGGTWQLGFDGEGAAALGLVRPSITVVVTDGVDQNDLLLVLQKVTGQITGYVKDSGNRPVANVGVGAYAYLNGSDYYVDTDTDASGYFALGVANGNWDIWVNCNGGNDNLNQLGYQCVSDQQVNVSNNNAVVNFTVQSFTTHLRGRVVDNTGTAVANLTLGASPPNGGNWSSSTQTGPDGSFDLGIFGGTWYLGFDTGGAAALGLICPWLTVVVTDGVDQNNLLLVLQKVTGQITGYVKDSGNRPVANVGVGAYANLNGTDYDAYTDTDASGYFALGVANGNWDIWVSCYGGNDSLNGLGYQCVSDQQVTITNNNAVANFTVQPCPPLQVTTTSPLPDGQVGSYYSFQLQAAGCYEPFNWSLTPGSAALPPNLNLAPDGTLSGTPTAPGTYSFYVRVTDTAAHTADQFLSLSISPSAPLQVTTTWLPGGTNGLFYSRTLGAAGGQPPYTWSLSPGSAELPPNLALGTNGVISGTPLTNGTFYFFVRVTDAALATVDQRLSLAITPAPLQITNTALPNGLVGASGGQPPYYWSLALGSANLPPGLFLDTTGLLWGTPLTNGTFNFFVQVTDANYASVSRSFGMVITARPTLSLPARPLARQFQFQVNGVAGQTCTIQVSTNLSSPNWLTLLVTNAPVNSLLVLDPAATNQQRFYRVKLGL